MSLFKKKININVIKFSMKHIFYKNTVQYYKKDLLQTVGKIGT
jgi:hypothetical protein